MSWDQLVDVLRVGREERAEELSADPVACPHDGEPLQAGPNGELFCPFGNWRQSDRHPAT